MLCAVHNKEYKGPNSRGKLWHVINFENKEYCTIDVPSTPYTPAIEHKVEAIKDNLTPISEPAVAQQTKELNEIAKVIKSDSMLKCNAMNNACALVAQKAVELKDLELTFSRILGILEK